MLYTTFRIPSAPGMFTRVPRTSKRVDGPANGHNEAHGLEVGGHGWGAVADSATSLTGEDLVE